MKSRQTDGQVFWESWLQRDSLWSDLPEEFKECLERAAAAVAARYGWRPIAEAPKGIFGEALVRESSEWFIGLLKTGEIRKVRRLPESYAHQWADREETYYAREWLVAWMPIPDAPPPARELNRERRIETVRRRT